MTSKQGRHRRLPRSRRRTPPGAPPGSLVVHDDAPLSQVDVCAYGPDHVISKDDVELGDVRGLIETWPVVWINVAGLGSAEIIRGLGDLFGLHGLALEDVVNAHQRPKVEEYEGATFIVAQMIHADPVLHTEQVSMFVGDKFVITFQEQRGDCFEPIRERLLQGKGRLRREGPGYLAYALIDAITDGYFGPVETYGDIIEALEMELVEQPNRALVSRIHDARRDLFILRKTIWSQREMVAALSRDTLPGFGESIRVYLRDCYDHTVQLLDMIETYRELAASLFELYLSTISNRMNEVMKVLTIIATIFMPIGVIAGIYGMNFNRERSPLNMPELDWYWGYPFALGLMALVAASMLFMFWRKRWIGRRE